MKRSHFRALLGVALVATLAAAWFAPADDTEAVGQGKRVKKPATAAAPIVRQVSNATPSARERGSGATAADLQVLSIRPRQVLEDEEESLFVSTRWTPPVQEAPQVVVPEPVPVAAPQAPPLPFRVLGRYEEAGQLFVFLQHNDQNLVVRVGDTIAGNYKVESLNGSTLGLVYLPLNQLQMLELGGSQ